MAVRLTDEAYRSIDCRTCRDNDRIKEGLGCTPDAPGRRRRRAVRLSGGESFWPGYCPRAWVFGDPLSAAWVDWVGLAYDLAEKGNLAVLLPPGAEFTAVALDLLHVAGGEVAAIDRERRETP